MFYIKMMKAVHEWYMARARPNFPPTETTIFLMSLLAYANLFAVVNIFTVIRYHNSSVAKYMSSHKLEALAVMGAVFAIHYSLAKSSGLNDASVERRIRFPIEAKIYIVLTVGIYVTSVFLIFFTGDVINSSVA